MVPNPTGMLRNPQGAAQSAWKELLKDIEL
jgi:hypothetical protein